MEKLPAVKVCRDCQNIPAVEKTEFGYIVCCDVCGVGVKTVDNQKKSIVCWNMMNMTEADILSGAANIIIERMSEGVSKELCKELL